MKEPVELYLIIRDNAWQVIDCKRVLVSLFLSMWSAVKGEEFEKGSLKSKKL